MIDPDYNPRRLASLIPYASPLPACSHLQPRLPGKPVQTMPPSPYRQGRRGNQCPRCSQPLLLEGRVEMWQVVAFQAVAAPFTLVAYFIVVIFTAGLGLFALPVITPLVCMFWVKVLAGDRSMGRSEAIALVLLLGSVVGGIPMWILRHEGNFTLGLGAVVVISMLTGCLGALSASPVREFPRG